MSHINENNLQVINGRIAKMELKFRDFVRNDHAS